MVLVKDGFRIRKVFRVLCPKCSGAAYHVEERKVWRCSKDCGWGRPANEDDLERNPSLALIEPEKKELDKI